MNFDKLTTKTREALMRAQEIARKYGHPQIDVLHLLLSLLKEKEGLVETIFNRLGIDVKKLEETCSKIFSTPVPFKVLNDLKLKEVPLELLRYQILLSEQEYWDKK